MKITLFITVLSLFSISISASTIKVGKNETIKTISQAVSKAKPGDTVLVTKGEYIERDIIVNKPLVITGTNLPVINAGGKGSIFYVRSNGVTIKGFKLINSEVGYKFENAAIRIEEVSNCTVEENDLFNNFFGVYLQKTNSIKVLNNKILSFAKQETNSGNGIHLWDCDSTQIIGNKISGHRDGIYLEFSKENLIKGNTARKNLRYGLHFMFSDNCSYIKNRFSENGAGVAVMYSSKIEMIENFFFDNKGPASYGLLLKDINQSHVSKNTFSGNTKGIYMEASGKSVIEKNIFIRNGWAIDLMANSMDNRFVGNSFYSNNFDVATNSKQNFNLFTENYWDNYGGYDLNKDGFGDVPYHPVSLFSVIVTEYKPSLILMRGLFTKLLDVAERVFPSLTPKQLIDEKPLMRRSV
jgi:nitrous oxidase accessory protein